QRRLVGGNETHLALDAQCAALNHVRLLRVLQRVDQVQLALQGDRRRGDVDDLRAAGRGTAEAQGGAPRGERGHVRGRRGRLRRRCRRAPRGALALVVDEALGVAGTALGAAAALAAATSPAAATAAAATLAAATAATAAAGATALGVVLDGQLGQA